MPHWLLVVIGVIFLVGGTLKVIDYPALGAMSIAGAILLAGQAVAGAIRNHGASKEE